MLKKLPRALLSLMFVSFLATGGYYACGDYEQETVSQQTQNLGSADGGVTGVVKAVRLTSFTAERTEFGVRLAWTTSSEQQCGSYRLLRTIGEGQAVSEHEALRDMPAIACKDSLTGAAYEQIDRTGNADQTLSYVLREYETTGKQNDHGPLVLKAAQKKSEWNDAPVDKDTKSVCRNGICPENNAGCTVADARKDLSNAWFFLGVLGVLFGVRTLRRRS